MKWNDYKKKISSTIKDYQENQYNVFCTGLCSEVGELMKCDFEEYKTGKIDATARKMEVGDVLWYIAAFENMFGLPDTIYHNIIGVEITVNKEDINKWLIDSDFAARCSELIQAVHMGELPKIQFELNELFGTVVDYCVFHDINISECLDASLVKLNLRTTSGKKSHTTEYKAVKSLIKNSGKEELLFEIDNEKDYKCLTTTFKDFNAVFNSGDIIIDFFDAINTIDKNLSKAGFTMNYGPKIRAFLRKNNKTYTNGFIYGDALVLPANLTKNTKTSTVLLQGYKTSIFKSDMTKLDQLLDYIHENRKQDA